MKTRTKVALAVLCALLLVTVSILGTVAYLTSEKTVTNTFTVGNVEITLDETALDENGNVKTGADRVTGNNFKIMPGEVYTKDPTVHVLANSEACYLFVEVTDGTVDVQDASNLVKNQILANSWTELTSGSGIYYKAVPSSASVQDFEVFGTLAIDKFVDAADLAGLSSKSITVTAYAIQQQGFDNASEAWAGLQEQIDHDNP